MNHDIVYIDQDSAISFLKENHADKEVIFIRPCDEWIAVYDGDCIIAVTGINYKKNHMSVDCSYVRSDYRRRGILKSFYEHIMKRFNNDDFVIYCRPYAAHVVKKYYGFKSIYTYKNGTEICVLRRKEEN